MNENGIEPVMRSIKSYGFNVPIIIDKNNTIICGHTRLKAAQKLKMDTVPCIRMNELSEKQAKAFRIADNKTSDFTIWDNKLLLEELKSLDFSLDGGEELYTGFDTSILFEDVINEKGSELELCDSGDYEITFKSESRNKIEEIKALWEKLEEREK